MRPDTGHTSLRVSVLTLLLLTSDAESGVPKCVPDTKVVRGTAYKAIQGGTLRINCTIVFCDDSPPSITWLKSGNPINVNKTSAIQQTWVAQTNSEGRSYLIFGRILLSDSGSYQCQNGEDFSHLITVSVSAHTDVSTVTGRSETTNGTSSPETDPVGHLWLYYGTAAGTALIIIGVMVSALVMQFRKGGSRKDTQTENQYMDIPMSNQAILPPHEMENPHSRHDHLSTDPECIYQKPNKRAARERNATSDHPVRRARVSQDDNLVYCKVKKRQGGNEREGQVRHREEEEDESTVVYAALNPKVLFAASATPQRSSETTTEYAAIARS